LRIGIEEHIRKNGLSEKIEKINRAYCLGQIRRAIEKGGSQGIKIYKT
jgi:hypothetical protein